MTEARYVRCRQCATRVKAVRLPENGTHTLKRHIRANPLWAPLAARMARLTGAIHYQSPTEVCPGSYTAEALHEALPVARRERASCPGCYRMIAVTPAGRLHRHECAAPPRGGEPPATVPPGWRCDRCGADGLFCACRQKAPTARPAPRRAMRVREDGG